MGLTLKYFSHVDTVAWQIHILSQILLDFDSITGCGQMECDGFPIAPSVIRLLVGQSLAVDTPWSSCLLFERALDAALATRSELSKLGASSAYSTKTTDLP